MKKLIPVIVLCLVLSSCKKSSDDESCSNSVDSGCVIDQPIEGGGDEPGTEEPGTGEEEPEIPTKPIDPPPTSAFTFDVNILFVNTTSLQQAKFDKAIEMIKKVVASEEFKKAVLNHTYNGSKTYVDNRGFSNATIYQKLLDGAETLKPTKNNAIDMEVELYYANNTTVGYTYANSKRVWVNRKYFDTNAVSSVASNLVHEWLHKLGFGHSVAYNAARDYSVPYAIGRMVRTIGPKL